LFSRNIGNTQTRLQKKQRNKRN